MRKLTYLIVTALMLFIVGCGSGGSGTNLASLLPGHKYYLVHNTDVYFSDGTPAYCIGELEFTADGKVIKSNENNKTLKETVNYKIEGSTLILFDKDNKEEYILISNTSSSITFKAIDKNKTEILYKTKEAVLKAIEDMKKSNQDSNQNEDSNNLPACKVSGDTVLIDEGQTCSYKNYQGEFLVTI